MSTVLIFPASMYAGKGEREGSTILTGWGVGSVSTRLSGGAITSVKWNFVASASEASCGGGAGWGWGLSEPPDMMVDEVVVTLVVVVVVVPSWETEVVVEGDGEWAWGRSEFAPLRGRT